MLLLCKRKSVLATARLVLVQEVWDQPKSPMLSRQHSRGRGVSAGCVSCGGTQPPTFKLQMIGKLCMHVRLLVLLSQPDEVI